MNLANSGKKVYICREKNKTKTLNTYDYATLDIFILCLGSPLHDWL